MVFVGPCGKTTARVDGAPRRSSRSPISAPTDLLSLQAFMHGARRRRTVEAWRARLEADGGGLENRYGAEASSWVRIPRPPLTHLTAQRLRGSGDPIAVVRRRKTVSVWRSRVQSGPVDDGTRRPAVTEDSDLLARVGSGDEAAIEQLYQRYGGACYALARRCAPRRRARRGRRTAGVPRALAGQLL